MLVSDAETPRRWRDLFSSRAFSISGAPTSHILNTNGHVIVWNAGLGTVGFSVGSASHSTSITSSSNVSVSVMNATGEWVAAYGISGGQIEVLVDGSPFAWFPPASAHSPDIHDEAVVFLLGTNRIAWWNYVTDIKFDIKTPPCTAFSPPIFGGSGDYVIYGGRNCGADGYDVLFLTDIRNPSAQKVYRIDEVNPPLVSYKPEYDAEADGIVYTSPAGLVFIKHALP